MAHKTLINGTSYNIISGKTLVSGTSYNITSGKTLVSGTSYNISFDSGPLATLYTDGTFTIQGKKVSESGKTIRNTYKNFSNVMSPDGPWAYSDLNYIRTVKFDNIFNGK